MLIPQSVGIQRMIFCVRQKKVSILLLRILHRQAECRKKICNDFNVNKDKLDDYEDDDNFWGGGGRIMEYEGYGVHWRAGEKDK